MTTFGRAFKSRCRRSSSPHWLAFYLWLADREAEACTQFRAIGGYCGADPWTRFDDPQKKFEEVRTASVLAIS